tara:strand:+ start:11294 stop:12040 length:747 start_codon:yes stop_codon:yes gene_type:complete
LNDILLSVSGLGHGFDARPALQDVSFALNRGERVAILGPSGCGKTTLLRLIAGLIPVQTGQITLLGANPAPGTNSAVIFQSPRLLPWRRVEENISIVLAHLPRSARAARVAALLARMGIAERAGDWPDDLSGGQRQRLALARALAMQAPLLLLDEPFANLDPLAREQMQDVVLAQASEEGSALIAVTHSVDEALILGDRILLMQAQPGRIWQEFLPELPSQGSARRKDAAFYPTLATISEALHRAAAP